MAVLAAILSGCSGRTSERYRVQGDTYLQLGRYDDAEQAYRDAIEHDDENAHAVLGLGRTLAARGEREAALTSFQDAVALAPDLDLAYLELVNTLLESDQIDEALVQAKTLEERDPALGGVLRASVLRRTGQLDEALDVLERLNKQDPGSTIVLTHLASAMLAAGDGAGADVLLKSASPGSTGVNLLRADVLGSLGRVGELIEATESIPERSPDETLVLAHALIRDGRTDEGLALLQESLQQDPSSGWANYVRGAYVSERGQALEAAPLLRAAAYQLPWEPLIMNGPGLTNPIASASVAPAEPAPPGNPGTVPGSTSMDWNSLWRKAALRQLVDARETFLTANEAGLRETLAISACFLGYMEIGLELANALPADSPVRGYVTALAEQDAQAAVNAIAIWNDREGNERILAMNATAFAASLAGARNSAVQILTACYNQYPEYGVSLFNLATVFRAADMPAFAAHVLRRLTANASDNLEAHLLLFQTLKSAGSEIEARQAAEVMFALFPDSREAVLAACGVYVDGGHLSVARRVAESYLESNPDNAEMNLLLAAILFREDRLDDALGVLTESDSGDLASDYTMLTALVYAAKQDWQGVMNVASTAELEAMPPSFRFALAAAHIKTNQKDAAAQFLLPQGEGHPAGAVVLKALGAEAPELSSTEQALAEAIASNDQALADFALGVAFQEARLHDTAFHSLRAVESALTVENDSLLGYLFSSLPYVTRFDAEKEALAIAEAHAENPRAWIGYAAIAGKAGHVAEKREALDNALEAGPDDPLVLMQRGGFFADQQEFDAAIAAYRRLLEIEPDNAIASNNLAYNLLLTNGDTDEALQAAKRAEASFPNDAHVLHTLGVAQLRAGQLEESKQNLATALERRPGDSSLMLDYGQALIESGDREQGIRYIQSALNTAESLGLEFDRRREAEAMLESAPAP